MKFFDPPGNPAGIYSLEHFIAIAVCVVFVVIAIVFSRNYSKKTVKNILKVFGITFVLLDICKIIFVWNVLGNSNPNTWVPFYFCSIFEFACLFAGFGNVKSEKIGMTFIFYGGIVASIAFLIYPSTSITYYPMLHFISIHSFVLHACMLYSGLLVLITKSYEPNKKDVFYYASSIIFFTICAFIVNTLTGSNLMFLSEKLGISFIDYIYDLVGQPFYGIIITLAQSFGLYYAVYFIYYLVSKIIKRGKKNE